MKHLLRLSFPTLPSQQTDVIVTSLLVSLITSAAGTQEQLLSAFTNASDKAIPIITYVVIINVIFVIGEWHLRAHTWSDLERHF